MASAALLLGERPSALELGGAVLICAGLAATLAPVRTPGPPGGDGNRLNAASRSHACAVGEDLRDADGDEQRFVEHLAPGEAQDSVAVCLQRGVAGAV